MIVNSPPLVPLKNGGEDLSAAEPGQTQTAHPR